MRRSNRMTEQKSWYIDGNGAFESQSMKMEKRKKLVGKVQFSLLETFEMLIYIEREREMDKEWKIERGESERAREK